MKTVIRLFFSLLVGVSIYSCEEDTDNVSEIDGTFQVKLNGRPLSLDSIRVEYSENSSQHKLDLFGFFTDYDSIGLPLNSKFDMELVEKLSTFNTEFEDDVLQQATYTANGIPDFKQDTKLNSPLFETGSFRNYTQGFVFLTGMDAEDLTVTGYFNLLSSDSTVLSGNFYKVQYTIDD